VKRTNVYLSEKQLERLRFRAKQEGVAIAELVRRALDTFLAWDDPTYLPTPAKARTRNGFSSPVIHAGDKKLDVL